MLLHDLLGTVGVALIVVMYFLLQVGKITPDRPVFSALNAAGSAMIIVSLAFEFNFSAFLIEAFWLAISLYGLARTLRMRKAA